MTPAQANTLIHHFAQKYLADLLPDIVFDTGIIADYDTALIDDWEHKVALLNHREQMPSIDRRKSEQQRYLGTIKRALWNHQQVWLSYEGRENRFPFNCFGLVQRDQQFFLVGSFGNDQDPVLLSVRKIVALALTPEASIQPAPDFNLQDYASFHLNQLQEPLLAHIEIEFPLHLLSYVKAYPIASASDYEIIEHNDYFTLRASNVPDSLRLRQWLSGFSEEARIIAPETLRKLVNSSLIDELTDLYNRRFFDHLFQREIKRYCRDPQYRFTLLSIDIDHFKKITTRYGHDASNEALKQVSTSLKKLRDQDAIRFSEQKFIILLTETTHQEGAQVVAERIRKAVKTIQLYSENAGEQIPLTISIGIAEFPTHLPERLSTIDTQTKLDSKTIQNLMVAMLKQADDALSRAQQIQDCYALATGLDLDRKGAMNLYLPDAIQKYWPF